MENLDREKIEKIIRTRKKAHGYFTGKSKVYRSFIDMEQNTYCDGKLLKKQKELIASGISVVINCQSCMEWHIKQAFDDGIISSESVKSFILPLERGFYPLRLEYFHRDGGKTLQLLWLPPGGQNPEPVPLRLLYPVP